MHAMCNDDPLEDHHSLSSYDLLVHEISDQKKEKDDKVIEDLIATPCDSIEDNACPLVSKE